MRASKDSCRNGARLRCSPLRFSSRARRRRKTSVPILAPDEVGHPGFRKERRLIELVPQRCASAPIRTTCPSPTKRAKASKTKSRNCSRGSSQGVDLQLLSRRTASCAIPSTRIFATSFSACRKARTSRSRPIPITAPPTRSSRVRHRRSPTSNRSRIRALRTRAGASASSPNAPQFLAAQGLLASVKPYSLMVDTRVEHPAQDMMRDLSRGDLDIAVLWGPFAGYYAKQSTTKLVVAPIADGKDGRMASHLFAVATPIRTGSANSIGSSRRTSRRSTPSWKTTACRSRRRRRAVPRRQSRDAARVIRAEKTGRGRWAPALKPKTEDSRLPVVRRSGSGRGAHAPRRQIWRGDAGRRALHSRSAATA